VNPEQILAKMLDVYAQAASYRDIGRVVTRYIYPAGAQGRPNAVQQFRTDFVRPDQLRFESWHLHPNQQRFGHTIVWACGGDIRRWRQSKPTFEQFDTLRQALLPAFSLSVSTLKSVAALLVPAEIEEWYLTNLSDVDLLPDEVCDGHTCYRLRARCSWRDQEPSPEEQEAIASVLARLTQVTGVPLSPERSRELPMTVWIDHCTLLIRRIESYRLEDRYAVEVIATYEPAVGVLNSEIDLSFDPPA
jgi:hypothetical protein